VRVKWPTALVAVAGIAAVTAVTLMSGADPGWFRMAVAGATGLVVVTAVVFN
jgi:hypothetical protein